MKNLPSHLAKLGLQVRKKRLRGRTTIDVRYFKKGDPEFTGEAPTGQTFVKGIPVEKLRERFGGNEGYLNGPTGERHYVRIDPKIPDGQGYLVSVGATIVPDERRSIT